MFKFVGRTTERRSTQTRSQDKKTPRIPRILNCCFLQVLLFSFVAFSSSAQSPDDPISIYGFNQKLLEHLIKEKVDSVRVGKRLTPLYNDSILYVAAKFHSEYLFKKKRLSHDQHDSPPTAAPQKRAEFFGAVNYLVGENVAYTVVNKPMRSKSRGAYTNATYNQTAFDLVDGWVHSPPHYKNMLNGDYNSTGLAVWPDGESGRIYAVQKFATILFKYDFTENKDFFSYSGYQAAPVVSSFDGIEQQLHKGKHVYKLRNPRSGQSCTRCFDTLYNPYTFSFLEYRNGSVYFTSYDVNWMFNLLQKKKDGLAIEVVPYNAYDCGNPAYYTVASRRNKQCVFSGKVLKPLYRKKALRGFRAGKKLKAVKAKIESGKVEKYEIRLGKVPKSMFKDYFELNLVLIQKKQVCRVLKFTDYCGDTIVKDYPLPLFIDSVIIGSELTSYRKDADFKIQFEKGKAEYRSGDFKTITDSLLSENFIADTIIIQAFSSIEGSEAVNKSLQERRSVEIAKALSANQQIKAVTKIKAEENWDLFSTQIQTNKSLKSFEGKTQEEIKNLLIDTTLQKKLEPFFKEQRSAYITVKASVPLNETNIQQYLKKKINHQKKKIDSLSYGPLSNPLIPVHIDSLIEYLSISARYIRSGLIPQGFLNHFRIDNQKYLDQLNYARVMYEVFLFPNQGDSIERIRVFYNDMVNLYNHDLRSFFIAYNMLNTLEQYGSKLGVYIQPEAQEKYLGELSTLAEDSLQKQLAQKLEINFWFRVCKLPWQKVPVRERPLYYRCLGKIHAYYADKDLSMEEQNKLAGFYIYHSRFDWARDLLEPYFAQSINNPRGLALLSKILYHNYEETKSTIYSDFLREVYDIIGKDNWCPMFVGPCNISFQVFDDPAFRTYYCERCSSYLNYAKRGGE